MGEKRIACKILIEEPEGKRPQGQPRSRRESSNKIDLKVKELGRKRIYLARNGISGCHFNFMQRVYVREFVAVRTRNCITTMMNISITVSLNYILQISHMRSSFDSRTHETDYFLHNLLYRTLLNSIRCLKLSFS
jgi:hypothetical protein